MNLTLEHNTKNPVWCCTALGSGVSSRMRISDGVDYIYFPSKKHPSFIRRYGLHNGSVNTWRISIKFVVNTVITALETGVIGIENGLKWTLGVVGDYGNPPIRITVFTVLPELFKLKIRSEAKSGKIFYIGSTKGLNDNYL